MQSQGPLGEESRSEERREGTQPEGVRGGTQALTEARKGQDMRFSPQLSLRGPALLTLGLQPSESEV